MRKYLAFDIETAKILPAEAGELLAHRPLGVACAVGVTDDLPNPLVWHGKNEARTPSDRMSRSEASDLVDELLSLADHGYTIVTWNGLGFDFDVLGEESGRRAECGRLAFAHIDMMFHAFCALGYMMKLQKAAEGMGLPGKTAGITGAEAPALWAAGKFDDVIRYCAQDVRTTLDVALRAEQTGKLRWVTRRGTAGELLLPAGWLTVERALELPLPDTSWKSDPPTRAKFTGWLESAR